MSLTTRTRFNSPLVNLADLTCSAVDSGGGERTDLHASITIVRRGLYRYRARGLETIADPGMATLCRAEEPYALAHPFHRDRPDRSIRIDFGRALTEEVFGPNVLSRELGTHLTSAKQILVHRMAQSWTRSDTIDPLAGEEICLDLLRAVASDFDVERDDLRSSAHAREMVLRVRAFIADAPEVNRSLLELAEVAGCSPYHLARLFRRLTGTTLRGYRLRMRLALALQSLGEGADDLSRLAHETGFADHSHMTRAFRNAFGATPSVLRDHVGGAGLKRRSTFVQARSEVDT